MDIHRLSAEDALAALNSGWDGLTAEEARRRLAADGRNVIERLPAQPWWLRLLRELVSLFSLILWAAAGLAFVAEWFVPGQGMARIGTVIVVIIVISGIFAFWQDYRAERMISALQELLPQAVKVLRDGRVAVVAADEIVVGDVILLEAGDSIPADCRLIEVFGLRVSNASLTGESVPQPCGVAPLDCARAADSANVVLAGTSVAAGSARGVVFAAGADTAFGALARLAQEGGEEVSPLRQELAALSRFVAVLAVAVGIGFLGLGVVSGLPFWSDFIFSVGIIVALVPEGLLPTLTVALVLAAQRMARRHMVVRHLASIETLGAANVICTDKTGTLTENRMRVRELWLGTAPVADLACLADSAVSFPDFFRAASLCHDLKRTGEGEMDWLGDPMELALLEASRPFVPAGPAPQRLYDVPFDSDRMRHSVLYDLPSGPVLYCKGAVEAVLPRCTGYRERGSTRLLGQRVRSEITQREAAMARRGLRVLALAMRHCPEGIGPAALEGELVFLGLVGFEDPPRPEVPDAVERCRQAGIRIIMITGDHPETALAVAREVGLVASDTPAVLSGDAIRALSDDEMRRTLAAPEVIFARTAADQKRRIVDTLKGLGNIVAVTGDGVNDAAALRSAHVGIAMGRSGTDVAKAASDMVLLDDNFASVVGAIEEGRAVFRNIRRFLTYVLVHTVAELVPFLAFALLPIPLPLTPIQALSVDMCTDSLTALGLGIERPDPETMRLPPRRRDRRLLDRGLAARSYLFLGVIEAVAAMAAFFFILRLGGWQYGQRLRPDDPLELQATTACLSAIIVMQIVNVFLCRSSVRSILTTGLGGNVLILGGVALEMALLVLFDYTPLGHAVLATAPVPAVLWLFLLPFAGGMLALEEMRKRRARSRLADRHDAD